jgi:sugar phosphate permease
LFLGLLMLFIVIRGIDGYLQAFGAPGMTKIKAAWFAHRERGGFSGIFGFMINLGRFGIFTLGPALLAGFSILGLVHVPPLHWRWLFWTPSAICALVAVGMALTVKETPEEAGFHGVIPDDSGAAGSGVRAQAGLVIRTIASNPAVWITACAYACTGAVRQAVDQWFPRYMQELHHVDLQSTQFQFLAFLIPFVASAGARQWRWCSISSKPRSSCWRRNSTPPTQPSCSWCSSRSPPIPRTRSSARRCRWTLAGDAWLDSRWG